MSETPQSKGGKVRAERLTPDKRRSIAIRAAQARWQTPKSCEGKPIPKAIAAGVLKLGNIPCAVLDDEHNTRVLTQEGFLEAIGRAPKAKAGHGATFDGLPAFLRAGNLKPFIDVELERSTTPIVFEPLMPGGFKGMAFGYRAQLLPKVCWVYHEAMVAKALQPSQAHIAQACTALLKGLTNVAIDALVDEATGFQDIRSKNALIKLLERYVSREALPWIKRFDNDFYKEMFRLHGYAYDPSSVKRPLIFSRRTEDIYDRLAPGVRHQLQRVVRRGKNGRPADKLHQHLREEEGAKHLKEHLSGVKALMKASRNFSEFQRLLDRAYPRFGTTLQLPFSDESMHED